jgi:hypothetical protein
MVLPNDNKGGPGVIDFQDALRGPIGYDLVSLLKDCYISWSRERVERWVRGYRRVLGNLGANVGDSDYQFMRWFDMIGVQRHIKVLGIFARLWHRDGKIGYLADLPLTLEYVRDACRRYPELVEFERWLEWRVVPQLAPATARQKEKPARSRLAAAKSATAKRRKAARAKLQKKKVAQKKKLKRAPRKSPVTKRLVQKRVMPKRAAAKRRKGAKKTRVRVVKRARKTSGRRKGTVRARRSRRIRSRSRK